MSAAIISGEGSSWVTTGLAGDLGFSAEGDCMMCLAIGRASASRVTKRRAQDLPLLIERVVEISTSSRNLNQTISTPNKTRPQPQVDRTR